MPNSKMFGRYRKILNLLFKRFRSKVTTLPEKLAEGSVEKLVIERNDDVLNEKGKIKEVAILKLAPNSSIKDHQHVEDNEIYVVINEMKVLICQVGDCHGFKNTSDIEVYIASIKYI